MHKYKILPNTRQLNVFCISERVAKPLRDKKFTNIYIAKKPMEQSIIAMIKKTHFDNI